MTLGMEINVDRTIYSDACISKAIYSLSKDYAISRILVGNIETLNVMPIAGEKKEEEIQAQVINVLNDYKLRQVIEDETHDIRTILYAKAFADFDDIDSDDEV